MKTCEFLGPPGVGKSTIFAALEPVRGVNWKDHHLWQDGLGLWCRAEDREAYRRHFETLPVTGGVVVVLLEPDDLRARHIYRHEQNPGRSLRPDVAVELLRVCREALAIMAARGVPHICLDGLESVATNAERARTFASNL